MSTATVTPKRNGAPKHSKNDGQTTSQERRLLAALHAFRRGDFSVRLPVSGTAMETEIALAFNECLEMKTRLLGEVKRVSRSISKDGRLSLRSALEGAQGGWQEHVDAYNLLIESVATPLAETSRVIGAVAHEHDRAQR